MRAGVAGRAGLGDTAGAGAVGHGREGHGSAGRVTVALSMVQTRPAGGCAAVKEGTPQAPLTHPSLCIRHIVSLASSLRSAFFQGSAALPSVRSTPQLICSRSGQGTAAATQDKAGHGSQGCSTTSATAARPAALGSSSGLRPSRGRRAPLQTPRHRAQDRVCSKRLFGGLFERLLRKAAQNGCSQGLLKRLCQKSAPWAPGRRRPGSPRACAPQAPC